MKKMVWRDKTTVEFDYVTLDGAISKLNGFKKQYGDKCRFHLHSYPYEEQMSLFLQVEEEESDREYQTRIKIEQEMKERQLKRDLDEYERLKVKFAE